jgi:hypothetical protein
MTDFEIFALDHQRHNHCQGCGGCLLDPSHLVQSYAAWCVGCRDRIKQSSRRTGARLPWHGGYEFVGVGAAADAPEAEP